MIAETTNAPGNAGLNTVRWTMQSARPMTEAEQQAGRAAADAAAAVAAVSAAAVDLRRDLRSSPPAQNVVLATVPPGEYRVVFSVGGREYAQTAVVGAER